MVDEGFMNVTDYSHITSAYSWTDSFTAAINCFPDVLHAYFGVCGLSLMGEPGVKVMHAALNVSQSAADHLVALHACLNTTLPSTKQCIWATHDAFYAEEYVKFFKRCLSENIPVQWNDDLDLSRLVGNQNCHKSIVINSNSGYIFNVRLSCACL